MNKKSRTLRKTPSELELVKLLNEGQISFPPFAIQPELSSPTASSEIDAIINLRWNKRRYRFVVECKRLSTPKAITEMIAQVRKVAAAPRLNPLLLVPYLADETISTLESAGISGIDLCGNGIVLVPDEILVCRTGNPNLFRSDSEIKNVFRGDSSLVGRSFLVVPKYESLQDLQSQIETRGGSLALSTVSKVCKSLASMLIIESHREKGGVAQKLRLLQPEKLIDLLASNFVSPVQSRTIRGKTTMNPEMLTATLLSAEKSKRTKVVRTGMGSVQNYAVMAMEPVRYFYCTDVEETLKSLGGAFEKTDRFANVSFSEMGDRTVYFDRRADLHASPVQTYLELASGDKRSQETAAQVRRLILSKLDGSGERGI